MREWCYWQFTYFISTYTAKLGTIWQGRTAISTDDHDRGILSRVCGHHDPQSHVQMPVHILEYSNIYFGVSLSKFLV
jgi:hypothetical protein